MHVKIYLSFFLMAMLPFHLQAIEHSKTLIHAGTVIDGYSNKASKHMMIGRFYLKERKYTAALNRFKLVVEKYSTTKFTPEALHRIVEIYFQIGLIEESTKTASILGHNYPDSKWYKYSYNLINKTEKQNSLFKKIKNIF